MLTIKPSVLSILAVVAATAACVPSASSQDAVTADSETKAETSSLSGNWSIQRLRGFTRVHNDLYLVDKSNDKLDHKVLDLVVDLNSKGEGTIEGLTRCKDIVTRINFMTSPIQPVLDVAGVMEGTSLMANTKDASACELLPPGEEYVTSKSQVGPALTAKKEELKELRPNSGLFGANWSSFRADKECKNLSSMKYISVKNAVQGGAMVGCIGHIKNDEKTLRLILLPSKQRHIILSDYVRADK